MLQQLHNRNAKVEISDDVNLVTADFENMFGLMPFALSKRGCNKYLDSRVEKLTPTIKVLKALDLCRQTNVFEFDGQLYTQVEGHGTGPKQAPPVACLGDEEEFFNT